MTPVEEPPTMTRRFLALARLTTCRGLADLLDA
jgi:hypothetical protein